MSRRKKILLQTNAPFSKTGLGENGRYLMKHLLRTGKYEVVYYCTNGVLANDPNLSRLPCKAYGSIPLDQNIINEINRGGAREVTYGSFFIDQIIRDEKPDIWWESDDIWSTPGYCDKPWFKHVHAILHKTPDSRPILEEAFKQARATPLFTTWSKFAADEMKRVDPKLTHVKHIYGMTDTTHFSPISREEKRELRKRFKIDQNALIFHTTNRNQLRKCFVQQIEAFAQFKRTHPKVNAKLHFHTAFNEKGAGWDIERLAQFHGLKPEDILATYICRHCGNWHIAPYAGEFRDCQFCGAKGSPPVGGAHDGLGQVTPNPQIGVPDEEMRLMHGVSDAGLSIFDSGGLERFSISSLLCGLPTAISNYSCGEDFMHLPFVWPVEHTAFYQPGTSFKKATPKIESLVAFMEKVWQMSEAEKGALAEAGRAWAVDTFSVAAIGAQWEAMFDALPPKDWSSVTLTPAPKNDKAPMPQIADPAAWVKALYNEILKVEPDPDGLKNWLAALDRGTPRDAIYRYFLGEAQKDNAKWQPPQDFGTFFDGKTDNPNRRKRILFVMKESGGDLFISTALFPGLKRLYPDYDLYVACEPKFADILAGNPHIHRVIPYHPVMEQELICRNYVEVYSFPALATQRQLNYLTREKVGLNLDRQTVEIVDHTPDPKLRALLSQPLVPAPSTDVVRINS